MTKVPTESTKKGNQSEKIELKRRFGKEEKTKVPTESTQKGTQSEKTEVRKPEAAPLPSYD